MLSPHKKTSRANKRKSPTEDHEETPESKKKKKNTINQLEKYYPIIID